MADKKSDMLMVNLCILMGLCLFLGLFGAVLSSPNNSNRYSDSKSDYAEQRLRYDGYSADKAAEMSKIISEFDRANNK